MNIAFFHNVLLFCWLTVFSCETTGKTMMIPGESPQTMIIQADQLGNFFVVNQDGILQKYGPTGKVSFQYNNHRAGKITSFDATEPMKILVFFKESQELILLDNTLSEISIIPLNQLDGRYFSAVARTNDGSLVMYDANNEILLKTDEKLVIEAESFPLFQEGFPGFKPHQIKCNNQHILLNDPKTGLILMDNFCNFRKIIPIQHATLVALNDDYMVYLKNDKLIKSDLIFFEEQIIPWPDHQAMPLYFGYQHDRLILPDVR
jgi:hypothetical protein